MDNKNDNKVIVKMKKEYLSSERETNKYKTFSLFLSILLAISFFIIIFMSFNFGSNLLNGSYESNDGKASEIKGIIKDDWVYGNDYDNLDGTLDNKMFYGLTSFEEDPYTTYMSVDDMEYFSNNIDKIQLGIGISYHQEYEGYLYVLEVYKDSGAYNAGIKKGDRIIAVDQHSTLNISEKELSEYVLGDEGTFVEVAVERDGEVITFDCERKYFDSTASVKISNDVVILTISSFGTNTAQIISDLLKDYTNYSKLIIDLRDDGGGYQESLLEIAGLFLENNTLVMKELDKQGNETKYYANYNDHYYNFDNIVIITNEYTASAAEVFAICMKEQHSNTTLVGSETYGKGVVQTSYKLSDGTYLKVTTSYWTSPNGISLKDGGIKPDIELKLDDAFYNKFYEFDDDSKYKYDSINTYVITASAILKYLDYPVGRTDGLFDKDFENALNKYKIDNELEPDGILDKTTYEYIIDSLYKCEKDEFLTFALDYIG